MNPEPRNLSHNQVSGLVEPRDSFLFPCAPFNHVTKEKCYRRARDPQPPFRNITRFHPATLPQAKMLYAMIEEYAKSVIRLSPTCHWKDLVSCLKSVRHLDTDALKETILRHNDDARTLLVRVRL